MAVAFRLGRAGAGKTYHCLKTIRTLLAEDPLAGPRLLLLVPEQAAVQMERAILGIDHAGAAGDGASVDAAHRAEVLSFRRLCHRVFDSARGGGLAALWHQHALSEAARDMVIRRLLRRRAGDLCYYRKAVFGSAGHEPEEGHRNGGLVRHIGATISEFIQEAVTPEDMADAIGGGAQLSALDAAKFRDLHLIYADYLAYLGDARFDPSQQLALARRQLSQCPWLDGAMLFVDGFASMTRQELHTLVALAQRCAAVEVTFLDAPRHHDARIGGFGPEMFARTAEFRDDLRAALEVAGVAIQPDEWLADTDLPRFCQRPALAALERGLITPQARDGAAADNDQGTIEIVETPTHRVEVDHAIAKIVDWTRGIRGPQYRYQDLAIIVRDFEPYHELLGQALTTHGMPYFIDRRRPTAHHPLVRLLRGLAMLAEEDYSAAAVITVLKTGLTGLTDDEVDLLENYILARRPSGLTRWRAPSWPVGHLAEAAAFEAARKRFVAATITWAKAAQGEGTRTGAAWSADLRACVDRLNAGALLARWTSDAQARGDADEAQEHQQVWRDVMALLDDLAFAFDDEGLDLGTFGDVLESGLAGLTLGLAPPMCDQILVGSIDRSRHPDIKAAVVLGFNDGVFPSVPAEDPILSDENRQWLRDAGLRVAPPTRDRLFDEALLAYIAVTRPSEALVISYALADSDDRPLRPSPYLRTLCDALPGLQPTHVADAESSRSPWNIHAACDLASRLVVEFAHRPGAAVDDPRVRGFWNELYSATRAELGKDAIARRVLASLDSRPALGAVAGAAAVPGKAHVTSVSRLETYAACPFQYFAKYVLDLRERDTLSVAPTDVGTVCHGALEDLVVQLNKRDRALSDIPADTLAVELVAHCDRRATEYVQETPTDARGAYRLGKAAEQLIPVICAQRNAAQAGLARVFASEVPFGFAKKKGMPALKVATPKNRCVHLRGYIDRVDIAETDDSLLGFVIDYKRTRDKRLDLASVFHGLSLQLMAYQIALSEGGAALTGRAVDPGGAFYIGLLPRYLVVDHPSQGSERDRAMGGALRPRGILSDTAASVLDRSHESGWSMHYGVYRLKDGSLGRIDQSDGVADDLYQALLDHTRGRIADLVDRIADGRMEVLPYRLGTSSPCRFCPMIQVCRFEAGLCPVRLLSKLSRSAVLERVGD